MIMKDCYIMRNIAGLAITTWCSKYVSERKKESTGPQFPGYLPTIQLKRGINTWCDKHLYSRRRFV